jgi:hypothetical protein
MLNIEPGYAGRQGKNEAGDLDDGDLFWLILPIQYCVILIYSPF